MIGTTPKLNVPGYVKALNGRLGMQRQDEAWQAAWSAIIDELLGFQSLQDDWDGEGAAAPKPALWKSAIQLAKFFRDDIDNPFPPPSRVMPGIEGTIIFEWQWPDSYVELEVIEPGWAQSMQITGKEPAFHCLLVY